jgi:hypothetical protein
MILAVCCLCLVSPAQSDEPARTTWVHEKGKITNTKGIFWRETSKDAKSTFYFVEVGRNQDFIELYDDSREVTFRLYKTKAIVKPGKDADWQDWWIGKWEK